MLTDANLYLSRSRVLITAFWDLSRVCQDNYRQLGPLICGLDNRRLDLSRFWFCGSQMGIINYHGPPAEINGKRLV